MSADHKRMREYRAILAEFGIEVIALRRTKHFIATASYRGYPLTITLCMSPSCRTHMQAFRANLKREVAKIDAIKMTNCP